MKRIYALILILVLSFGLISCADKEVSSNDIKEDNEVSNEFNNDNKENNDELNENKNEVKEASSNSDTVKNSTSSIENETKTDDSKKVVDEIKEKETSKNSTTKINEYEITSKNYTKNNVKINYPQIKNLSDSEKLKTINKDLQEGALKILDDYSEDDPNLTALTLNVNYEVKLKNKNYISVVYKGESNVKGAAHPASIFYTTNIDVEKGSSVRLSDYANIDDILKKLKGSKNIKVLAENDELAEAQRNFILNIEDNELIYMLKNADFYKINGKIQSPKEGAYSYLDKDGIVISVQVNHAIGDHSEFKLIN
ncbi:PdaC/SigV domain-containing protein [Clostridium taeniosporum]|uniref:DUF4163 domain-containing protein n=1 Tax=Clostridium taeniosporum TaxID=394958 RepID=A0A1D7XP01_9CLOT|nr:DUF4163 domain-containing protein [Clostridium taeniosporum]AOR25065.1 DUF4163 domain-containing protein [Clostridium taeniosporum]